MDSVDVRAASPPFVTKPWIAALGATLLMQTMASFMTQSLPVIGPMLTASFGLAPETIGNLSALNAFGTVCFLAFGGPILARLGPVRMLQVGAAMSALGLLAVGIGTMPALALSARCWASFLRTDISTSWIRRRRISVISARSCSLIDCVELKKSPLTVSTSSCRALTDRSRAKSRRCASSASVTFITFHLRGVRRA